MEFEALELKISDLPKDISISVPPSLTEEQIKDLVEDLRSQILYNSRLEENSDEHVEVSVTVLERLASSLRLRATL